MLQGKNHKLTRNVHHPLVVEHMESRPELLLLFLALELDETREEEDHVAAFVQDRAVAVVAADFAGKLVLDGLVGGVVPEEECVSIF